MLCITLKTSLIQINIYTLQSNINHLIDLWFQNLVQGPSCGCTSLWKLYFHMESGNCPCFWPEVSCFSVFIRMDVSTSISFTVMFWQIANHRGHQRPFSEGNLTCFMEKRIVSHCSTTSFSGKIHTMPNRIVHSPQHCGSIIFRLGAKPTCLQSRLLKPWWSWDTWNFNQ